MGSTRLSLDRRSGVGLFPVRALSRGFVLVEALVVAVIVAILAVVAIPLYSGFIEDQKEKAAIAVAQTAAITAGSLYRRNNAKPTTEQLNAALVLPNATQFTITVHADERKVLVVETSNPDFTAEGQF